MDRGAAQQQGMWAQRRRRRTVQLWRFTRIRPQRSLVIAPPRSSRVPRLCSRMHACAASWTIVPRKEQHSGSVRGPRGALAALQ